MSTLANAFVRLAGYLSVAEFSDPDEAQGAEELVSWCLSEVNNKERAQLREAAARLVAELRARGSNPASIEFYEQFE